MSEAQQYWFIRDNLGKQGMGKSRDAAALDYIRMGGRVDHASLERCRPLIGGEEICVERPIGRGAPERDERIGDWGCNAPADEMWLVSKTRLSPPHLFWWELDLWFYRWSLMSAVPDDGRLVTEDVQVFPMTPKALGVSTANEPDQS